MQDKYLFRGKESEAINFAEEQKQIFGGTMNEFLGMAIEALEDVQQYREIGTVEECREAVGKMKPKEPWKDRKNNLRSYDLRMEMSNLWTHS